MKAVGGAPTRLYVRAFPRPFNRSGSVAAAVKVTTAPGTVSTIAGTPAREGASFNSRTKTVTGRSVSPTPSDTRTTNCTATGPWISVGVQANAPVAGSMTAPAGAPASE